MIPAAPPALARGTDRNVDPNYLTLSDCPTEPGCPALILLDETELSNVGVQSSLSRRRLIKVFTQEGIANYSDLEVAAMVGDKTIDNLAGRTILGDGRFIPLARENVHTKTSFKHGRTKVRTKYARFSGVVPGAIIEYSYDLLGSDLSSYWRWTWEVQDDLPVLGAGFVLKSGGRDEFEWRVAGIDEAAMVHTQPRKNVDRFTIANVPAVRPEPFAAPDNVRRGRVYFYHKDAGAKWMNILAGIIGRWAGEFLAKTGGVPAKVKDLTKPDDAAITKLKAFYRFVQKEIGAEEKRVEITDKENVKEAQNVGEVLARGYGGEFERTMLFLAMAREAGMEIGILMIAGRDNAILDPRFPDASQFDSFAATVKVGGNWAYYDPAVRHCPFGAMSAEKEGSVPNAIIVTPSKPLSPEALRGPMGLAFLLSSLTAPARLVKIPQSTASKSVLLRVAEGKLDADGSMQVEGTDQGSGHVDLDQREAYEDLEPDDRRKRFAETVHVVMPRAEVVSVAFDDIGSFEKPATIRYSLRVPSAATVAGDRLILTPAVFSAGKPTIFTSESRRSPVSFPHAERTMERLTFLVPPGYAVGELPEPITIRDLALVYQSECKEVDGKLEFSRRFEMDPPYLPVEDYARLKAFLDKVREADQQVVILRRAPGGAGG